MEFEIESLKNYKFREAKASAIDILSLANVFDPDKFGNMRTVYQFALEHIEVEINGKWTPVKMANREVYMPLEIENNLSALNELCAWYIDKVMTRVFLESEGSKQNV